MSECNPFRDGVWRGFDVKCYDGPANFIYVDLPEDDVPWLADTDLGSLDIVFSTVNTRELFKKKKLNLEKVNVYDRIVIQVGINLVDLIKHFVELEDVMQPEGYDFLVKRRQCAVNAITEALEFLKNTEIPKCETVAYCPAVTKIIRD